MRDQHTTSAPRQTPELCKIRFQLIAPLVAPPWFPVTAIAGGLVPDFPVAGWVLSKKGGGLRTLPPQ